MQQSKLKPMAPTTELKTAVLLLDCCDFCVSQVQLKALVGVRRAVATTSLSPNFAACSFNFESVRMNLLERLTREVNKLTCT